MNKLNALLIAIVATASMAFATPPPAPAPEMVAVANQGGYTSGYGAAGYGAAEVSIAADTKNFAGGSISQGSQVTTTQKDGFGSITASTDNTSVLNATNNSSYFTGVNSFSVYGSTATNLLGNGSGQSCGNNFTVALNANGVMSTATQAALTTSLGFAFGNTATYGSFNLAYTGQGGVIGSGSTVGQGTSTVTPTGAFGAPGISVNTFSSSVSTVCPVKK
jgi:hypothetical protein